MTLARGNGGPAITTGNVHYQVQERHQLQDCLVAIRYCRSVPRLHHHHRFIVFAKRIYRE